jgi:phosphatidylglycerol:prolipoprotein diacylglycerol transferase
MHPILFSIGSFRVGTYGLLLAIGFLAALWLARRLAIKESLAPDAIVDLGLTLLIAGLLGGKLLMMVVDIIRGEPPTTVFSLGTLRAAGAIHGGILMATAAFFWRIRKLNLPFGKTLDCITTAVPLGQAIGRLGCIAAGCCYGTPCEYPWAISFHNHDAGNFCPFLGVPLHPIQLYFCLSNLAIMAILLLFRRFRKFYGQISAMYFMLEGAFRIVLETWRGDVDRGDNWFNVSWLSTGRITGILLILIGLGIWTWAGSRMARTDESR